MTELAISIEDQIADLDSIIAAIAQPDGRLSPSNRKEDLRRHSKIKLKEMAVQAVLDGDTALLSDLMKAGASVQGEVTIPGRSWTTLATAAFEMFSPELETVLPADRKPVLSMNEIRVMMPDALCKAGPHAKLALDWFFRKIDKESYVELIQVVQDMSSSFPLPPGAELSEPGLDFALRLFDRAEDLFAQNRAAVHDRRHHNPQQILSGLTVAGARGPIPTSRIDGILNRMGDKSLQVQGCSRSEHVLWMDRVKSTLTLKDISVFLRQCAQNKEMFYALQAILSQSSLYSRQLSRAERRQKELVPSVFADAESPAPDLKSFLDKVLFKNPVLMAELMATTPEMMDEKLLVSPLLLMSFFETAPLPLCVRFMARTATDRADWADAAGSSLAHYFFAARFDAAPTAVVDACLSLGLDILEKENTAGHSVISMIPKPKIIGLQRKALRAEAVAPVKPARAAPRRI